MKENTIVAISTPIGTGGISIVRMSGNKAKEIAQTVFFSHSKNAFIPGYMTLGIFKTKNFSEKCICVYFKNPKSYTGEDLIEFQCHGGEKVTEGILSELVERGAALAEGGEFTKRAFMNGKLSLDEAEGVIDIINAESESEIRAGYNLMQGGLKKEVQEMQKNITDMLAKIEVSLDYPEHDYEDEIKKNIKVEINEIKGKINNLLETSGTGIKLKTGIKVLIVGNPNVGKSSLMNAMLNYDRAIVTNISGTTRDILEENYLYKGVKFVLVDTAGIKENAKSVEKIGVELALKSIDGADIVLFVVDGSNKLSENDKSIYNRICDKKHIVIANKSDKGIKISEKDYKNFIEVSAKNKKNIEELKNMIYDMVISEGISSGTVITNTRHVSILKKAQKDVEIILSGLKNGSLDLLALDIKALWLTLGEITGETNNEEIISAIFSSFCVGK